MAAYRKGADVPIYPKEPEKIELTPAQIRHRARNRAVAWLLGIIAGTATATDIIIAIGMSFSGSWPYLVAPSLALAGASIIALQMSPSFPSNK